MDDPNITIEEYIRLEEEQARRSGKVYNWETTTYATLLYEPTVSSLNNDETDFRISFEESDDEDYTVNLDNSTSNVLILLDSWTSGLLVYKEPLSGKRSKQPFILEESPIDTMADQRTMAELLRAPTEGYVEEDERVEETLTDPDLSEYNINVPPRPVQKYKPPSQREYVVHQRDPLHPNIPYPSRRLKQKQQEKDEKMLKALLSNKEKIQELENTPLNENCSAVILKKLPEKLRDPGKFLIPCGFSKLKCKALADLGASINLMPLFVWKKLGVPELISTRMTLELANRTICTPAGIAKDVFVSVGKFTFPSDFVNVDYESVPKVPLIFGRPFLRAARTLCRLPSISFYFNDPSKK
uniref:Reverse transcriptase domain-containing protein n=1 Tax=Tanacetum cinerariifolium TaxID=118510 RepID=A0A6L2JAU7_TANCI|nr:reverse transcriptase domain-containing protein [Tanacetum cinerariifolium]